MIASSCGGATSGGGEAPSNDARSGELDASGIAEDAGGPDQTTALDGRVATFDGSRASDAGRSTDASASDANGAGTCPSSGASQGGQTVPQVFASVSLGAFYDPNHNGQNICGSFKSLTEVFSIGTATGSCATVNVNCSITGSYDVSLNASLGSIGTLQINGHVDGTAGGTMVSADIAYRGNDYTASGNCSVAFTYGGHPVPQQPPIAAGRIWGHLSCPQMIDPQGLRHVILMDGTQIPEVCGGEVDFLFDKCPGANQTSGGGSDAAVNGTGQGGDASGPRLYVACGQNTDCDLGLLCTLDGLCRPRCTTAADCGAGGACITDNLMQAICQPATLYNKPCDKPTDCPQPLACATDYRCRNRCMTDADCNVGGSVGRVCAADGQGYHYCATTSEVSGGVIVATPPPNHPSGAVTEPVLDASAGGG